MRGLKWWLIGFWVWLLLSVVVAELAPLVIVPLFFKYTPLRDETLTKKIMGLAQKMGVKVIGVFEIDFSAKTRKANAAFFGLGATKRIVLADTLKNTCADYGSNVHKSLVIF
jgi:STE24 endopeptidase